MSVHISPFGEDHLGRRIDEITLTNQQGSSVSLMNYGAHIRSIRVPDNQGILDDVCLGFDTWEEYAAPDNGYLGGTIGRYCNRISRASFTLNGKVYRLNANEGNNTLHGGKEGFDKKWWVYEITEGKARDFVAMYYTSHDGEEGFPGKVRTQVVFSFGDDHRLEIAYLAQSDQDTVFNITNHSYFNLSGQGKCDIKKHLFQVHADSITEVDEQLLPTGWEAQIGGTPYDLRSFRSFADCLKHRSDHPMFDKSGGFDVNYILQGEGLRKVASFRDPVSKREMIVLTDQPCAQLYTGQGLLLRGKKAVSYGPYSGFAFETQHPPDSVNQSNFETTVLRKGETFQTVTAYCFGTYH